MTRILVDMDAVIADWPAEFDRRLDSFGRGAAGIPRTKDQNQWDLQTGRTRDEREIIAHVMSAPGFYRVLRPIEGAKQALKSALKAGHDVRIVSTPDITNPTCASDKLAWLVRHYGQEWAKRLILTGDKTVIRGDILVDDKPVITGDMEPTWLHVIFGDYAYNRHVNGVHMNNWRSFPELLELIGEPA